MLPNTTGRDNQKLRHRLTGVGIWWSVTLCDKGSDGSYILWRHILYKIWYLLYILIKNLTIGTY